MKYLVALAFMCFSVVAFGQTKADVKFTAMKHSFGKIKQNVPATYTFTFKNASTKKPLIIESATAQCGCTTPEYPKSPVGKGKTGTIKVTYNAAAVGAFTKTVTVKFANIAEPVVLTIDGDVQAATK
jgi:hypothetical protein